MQSSRKIAVGAFVLGGLILFALGLFWIGDRRFLFSENMELYAEFANVSGLKSGSRVAVSGMDAGEVLYVSVPPLPKAKFRVRFRVLEQFRPILRLDSVATIQTDGLVGNKLLQVDPGTEAARPAVPGDTIASREPLEFSDILRETVETVRYARSAVDEVKDRVDDAVTSLVSVNKSANGLIEDVGNQVEKITKTTENVVNNVDEVVRNVRAGRGSMGKLLTDDRLYEDVRSTVQEMRQTSGNIRQVTDDVNGMVDDIRKRELGKSLERTVQDIEQIAAKGKEAMQALLPETPGDEGLAATMRKTLADANEAMSDLAENTEALKRNWFFRGFYNSRGFFDIDSVSVADYRQGKFASKLKPERRWVPAGELFTAGPENREGLTEEGRHKLDLAIADYLLEARNTPLMIEGYAAKGDTHEQFLVSRDRALRVREYLVHRFSLPSSYVGFIPLGAEGSPGGEFRNAEGVALVMFKDPKAKK
jgi:phospholipid/cholesterol/gamma-HCH transport system substrate-binding protein